MATATLASEYNDILREWLGAPDILAVITQHQLRWIGHVARMPQDESVGTQRPPGRLKGKWYRQTLVEAMRVAEIPITICDTICEQE